jgi:hypothetical protein
MNLKKFWSHESWPEELMKQEKHGFRDLEKIIAWQTPRD